MDTAQIRAYIIDRLIRPGKASPGEDDPLFSNGRIDSFGVLELIAFLEERYHVEIDTTKYHILDFDTIRKVGAMIDKEKAKGGDRDGR